MSTDPSHILIHIDISLNKESDRDHHKYFKIYSRVVAVPFELSGVKLPHFPSKWSIR